MFTYSLKEGINDGFLTPFRVKQISTTLDDYIYTPDDTVLEGEVVEVLEVLEVLEVVEVVEGRRYSEAEFNRSIEIERRERQRVEILLSQIDPRHKTLVFCATQEHALVIRDLINQRKSSRDPNYCQRVTAAAGELGNTWLLALQDNEKTIPTILTTSQTLSTGVDARNVCNIVLLRPINSMIEFKQIIGRGTRLYDGKDYFTILDFVKAHHHFSDPEWDGEPIAPEGPEQRLPRPQPEDNDALNSPEPRAASKCRLRCTSRARTSAPPVGFITPGAATSGLTPGLRPQPSSRV